MKKNQFFILVAVVLGLMLFIMFGRDSVKTSVKEGDGVLKLFPAIKDQMESISTISITQNNQSVNLDRKDGAWVVREKYNYPAKTKAIREILADLSTMDLVEKKTKKPANYPTLEIDDEKGIKIVLSAAGKEVDSAIFGKSSSGLKGRFVRRGDNPQVWLGDKALELNTDSSEWIIDEIVNVDAGEVHSVDRKTKEQKFTLLDKAGKFTLENIPTDKQLADDYIFSGVKSALSNLKAKDVIPADKLDWQDAVVSTYKTQTAEYQVSHIKKDDKDYIKLSVKALPAEVKTQQGSEAEPQSTDATKPAIDVSKLNTRWANWAYEIASYKAEGIYRGLDELLVAKANAEETPVEG